MSSKHSEYKELLSHFCFEGELQEVSRVNDGHINNTYVFTFADGDSKHMYLVQELNTFVFKNPIGLMDNVAGVTKYLREQVIKAGGNPERECLTVFPAKDGKNYYIDSNNKFWRCYNYIFDTHTVQQVESPEVFKKAAEAFGKFQCMLADYPSEELVETIPNFHNTVSRLADFKKAVAENLSGRKDNCKEEIEFILAREKDCSRLVDMLAEGKLPLRVTHNDTKLNNVMLDNTTNEGICVVDLDTVMPGLSIYDFGDSIRFGASTAAEDEKDLDKVDFSLEYFRAYAEGYLSAAGKSLTKEEIENLAFGSKLMTLECGMRFLGDYINGDVYFKTGYDEHNLVRARTQLKLVKRMEESMNDMNKVIDEICNELNIAK